MKTITIFTCLAIAALNGLMLVPSLRANGAYFLSGSMALSFWLAIKFLLARPAPVETPVAEPAPPPAVPPPPPPAPEIRNLSEAEAIALLGAFQSKGRFVDFLMDDIAAYSDAQVGAAARVVHQGCKAALQEHFAIVPISTEKEGTRITVPADAPVGEYSLVGKISGEPPFSGVLAHKGWKATSVKLPRSIAGSDNRLPPIAPAQVEVR